MRISASRLIALAVAIAAAACTHKTEAPALSGPSSHSLTLNVSATPDRISRDGASVSAITVQAYGPDGRPLAGITLRMDIQVGNQLLDLGTLSARTIVTGSDGAARAIYTAPPTPQGPTNAPTVVNVLATPLGTDSVNEQAQFRASITLMPIGILVPPSAAPVANFTSTAPTLGDVVSFDGTSSKGTQDGSTVVSAVKTYNWDFGDGTTASGPLATHTFRTTGQFLVSLTVTNDLGLSNTKTTTITVTAADITGTFTLSPTPVTALQPVFFNAGLVQTAPNHSITSYDWNFGDGDSTQPLSGVVVTHTFARAATYQVVLTVSDDLGRRKSITQAVAVGAATGGGGAVAPTAEFVWNDPQSPTAPASVTFNAASSTAPSGSSITTYSWSFQDTGTQATGISTTHAFAAAGTWSVTLTVIDNLGRTATNSKNIVVQ
jgi:PKD repeat protein